MTRALMQTTQIGVTLTLTVVSRSEQGIRLGMVPLVDLAPILLWLWSIREWANQVVTDTAELIEAIGDLLEAAGMVGKVYLTWGSIIINALRFGLGI